MLLNETLYIESTTTVWTKFVAYFPLDLVIKVPCLFEHHEHVPVLTASFGWRWSVVMNESFFVRNGVLVKIYRQPMEPLLRKKNTNRSFHYVLRVPMHCIAVNDSRIDCTYWSLGGLFARWCIWIDHSQRVFRIFSNCHDSFGAGPVMIFSRVAPGVVTVVTLPLFLYSTLISAVGSFKLISVHSALSFTVTVLHLLRHKI